MDLFAGQQEANRLSAAPLALRMRPRTLDEFVGQERFMAKGQLLRRTLEADRLSSVLFYGPPGTGKTSLAHIIANTTRARFEQVNAAAVGVKELRELLQGAQDRLDTGGERTILFVDELHRFSRNQQDVLLDDVERGTITLIGATTENPFFAINAPLISRSQIYEFETLSTCHIIEILEKAVADKERGLGRWHIRLNNDAAEHLAKMSDGDARRAITALEVAVGSEMRDDGEIVVSLAVAEASIQRKALRYDSAGSAHFDTASALIKSIRGGDPDAAVFWLATMLEAGEDPRFIARRVVISASKMSATPIRKDWSLPRPAAHATMMVGLPECQLALSQAVTYLACAAKSNAAAQAIWTAREDIRTNESTAVPRHLRNVKVSSAGHLETGACDSPSNKEEGAGHDYFGVDKVYYSPTNRGAEAQWHRHVDEVRRLRRADGAEQ